jgi:hypothetical protein
MQTASSYIMLENDMQGLVVQDANMDMQETLEDANGCCLVGIVHQWQVPIKTCCYIDERAGLRDDASRIGEILME